MLKSTAPSIAPSITNLFNASLKTGFLPVAWKSSHVVPIYTKNTNYRPISLLPILSKILEHHICKIITEQLSTDSFISQQQWGFQAKKSTTSALLRVTHDWHEYLDKGREPFSLI